MIGNEVSRWVPSALFAGLGAWYLAAAGRELFPLGRRSRLVPAVGAGLQAVMCAVMIGMSWSWGAGIPAIAQVTVFTARDGWFAGHALFGARTGAASVGEPPGGPAGGHSASWYHAAMMAAMVWMAVAMSALTTPRQSRPGAGPRASRGRWAPCPVWRRPPARARRRWPWARPPGG